MIKDLHTQDILETILSPLLQTRLFSHSRLAGYTDTTEHENNLALIASIAHKIGIVEIILRNTIDTILSQSDTLWLENLPNTISCEGDLQTQSRDKIISSQNLGFWLKAVEHHKIHNQLFNLKFLDNLDFKKYFVKNPRYFYSTSLMRHHKVKAILLLLRLIRNRAFHFENLYKIVGNGYPRLNVKIMNKYNENIYIAIHPSKIQDFLNDILASFHKDLIHYAER